MNKQQREQKKRDNLMKYHSPKGQSSRRELNTIHFSTGESKEHFMAKCEKCYELREQGVDFITEAIDKYTNLRHDIVEIMTDFKYEIETDPKRAERFKEMEKVILIRLWEDG